MHFDKVDAIIFFSVSFQVTAGKPDCRDLIKSPCLTFERKKCGK